MVGRKKIADICDICERKFHGTYYSKKGERMFLCCKHLHQMQRHGEIMSRTKNDPNELIEHETYYELCLYSGQSKQREVMRTKIDKNVIENIRQYKWCAVKKGQVYYIKTDIKINGKRRTLYLVNLILGSRKGFQIDHRNGDSLDNRKDNLRFCTQQQNLMNKSKARGIWWNVKSKKWESYINVNGKKKHLGHYFDEQAALNVRRKAEEKYFGEFAPVRKY